MTEYKEITLNRQIAIKAIVTDDFKKMSIMALERQIVAIQSQLSDVERSFALVNDDLTAQGKLGQLEQIKLDVVRERARLMSEIERREFRVSEIKEMALGIEITDGFVQGPITVKPGDNLMEILNGIAIVVKDGIIEKIVLESGK